MLLSKSYTLFAFFAVALGHTITLNNKCKTSKNVVVASCIDLPPGTPCAHYTGPQPGSVAAHSTHKINVPSGWNGRVFIPANTCDHTTGDCYFTGCKGCTLTEFNMDAGGLNYYDISNINSFTQSTAISANTCQTVKCTSSSCSCSQAYPPGDSSDFCGTSTPDHAVRACGASHAFQITYCP